MKNVRQFFRLLHINWIIARYGLDEIIFDALPFHTLRILTYCNPYNWRKQHTLSRGQRIRFALEELGPVFIKFGQALSTRRDVLPVDIADELAKLQDQVAPFPDEVALELIEKVYGQTAHEIFAHFDPSPLASASIAQVHKATLKDGHDVVVKILRPDIKKLITRDVALMYTLADLAARYWPTGRRLRPREVVAEFDRTLMDELDLMREAANASQLRRNFLHSPLLHVPEIYWDYARHSILVMERIHGIPIADIESLKAYGFDLKKLAESGVEIFFTQVFRDCFFHADMHPGNIFVSKDNPQKPQYIAVDFGIMGTLNPQDQRYLAENFLAFFNRDYRRVAILHVESGWVPANTRIDQLEAAVRTVCEPIFEKPLQEISCGQMLLRLFQIAGRFNMEIQPQLVLLQKTLLNIEGLGRQLYPELNLWDTAKPFLERWVKQQLGPQAFWRKLKENAPLWLERLPEIPNLLYESLQQIKTNTNTNNPSTVVLHTAQDDRPLSRQYSACSFIYGLVIGALLVILAIIFQAHFTELHFNKWF